MTTTRRSAFIRGTLVLTAAGIAIRVLGAVYRIPLAWILGDRGLGIYAIPSQIYWMAFMLSSAGLPVGISQVIAAKIASGRTEEAWRAFRLSRNLLLAGGLAASLGLFFGAPLLIRLGIVAEPDAYLGIQAIAPVVFFSAVTSAYRGLFAGLQFMTPIAISQLTDQVLNVTGTLLFAYLLLPRGIAFAAAGGNLGSLPGAIGALTTMVLFFVAFHRRGRFAVFHDDCAPTTAMEGRAPDSESSWSLLGRILSVALPVSFASIAMSLVGIADSILVIGRLQEVGVARTAATAFYGQLNQMAQPFINATVALASAVGVSLVPALATLEARAERERLPILTGQALELTLIFALPAATGLYVLATPLTQVIFRNAAAGAALAALSGAALFWSLQIVTAAALQGIRRAGLAMWSLLAGLAFKVALSYILIPTALGVRGSAYATALGFALGASLNLWWLGRLGVARVATLKKVVRPVLASLVMGFLVRLTFKALSTATGAVVPALAAAVLTGVIVYGYLALALGIFSDDLLGHLPVLGPFLGRLARRLRLA